MPLSLDFRRCLLACALLLSACSTLDTPPPDAKPAAREVATPKPAVANTPFADDPGRRTVYFGFGEATINSAGAQVLRENAQQLKNDPQLVVTVVGHTDNLGSAAYNLAVADKRIDAATEKLRSFGVPKNQLRRLPLGSEQSSKETCDSEPCRQAMRKVELVYERR